MTLLTKPEAEAPVKQASRVARIAARAGKLENDAMADRLVTLTCPVCGHAATETMPTDRCVVFYECERCGTVLRPKSGDCCVFCSYGDKRCPFVQDSCERPGLLN
jgi:hypothetical protein